MNGEFPNTFENLDPETDYEIGLRYTNAAGETQACRTSDGKNHRYVSYELTYSLFALYFG